MSRFFFLQTKVPGTATPAGVQAASALGTVDAYTPAPLSALTESFSTGTEVDLSKWVELTDVISLVSGKAVFDESAGDFPGIRTRRKYNIIGQSLQWDTDLTNVSDGWQVLFGNCFSLRWSAPDQSVSLIADTTVTVAFDPNALGYRVVTDSSGNISLYENPTGAGYVLLATGHYSGGTPSQAFLTFGLYNAGAPGTSEALLDNIAAPPGTPATASPAGVSAASALGATTDTGRARDVPTGQAAVSALGTPAEKGAAKVAVTGQATAAGEGTAVGKGAGHASPAGVGTGSTLGAPTERGAARLIATGLGATSALGAALARAAGRALAAGVGALSALGGATEEGKGLSAPLGVQAASALGTVTASGSSHIAGTATPSGVAVGSTLGTPTEAGAARFTLTGVGATGLLGAVQAVGRAVAQFLGLTVTPAVGTVTVTGAGRALPAGVEAVALTGDQLPPVTSVPNTDANGAGGPARHYRRPPKGKPAPPLPYSTPGHACPGGVGATAKFAPQVKARGASAAAPVCIPPCQAGVGQVDATGYHNLTDEEWLLLIEAAA